MKEVDIIKVSVIVAPNDENTDFLDSFLNQTLDDIEIILITDNDISIDDDRIKAVSEFSLNDACGEYVVFANPTDKYYLVALETLYNYSALNKLDVLFYSAANLDLNTKEIYERKLNNYQKIAYGLDKEVFTHKDISKYLFSITPDFTNIFYRMSFLSDVSNDVYSFYKSILNAKRIGIFPNQLYIKGDDFKSTLESGINFSFKNNYIEYLYRNIENDSLSKVIEFADSLTDLFEQYDEYGEYTSQLSNLKVELIRYYLMQNGDETELLKSNLGHLSGNLSQDNKLFVESIYTDEKIQSLESEIDDLKSQPVKQKQLNESLLSSNSWKLLAPVRKFKRIFKK